MKRQTSPPQSDNVTVFFSEHQEHSTEFDGSVDRIEVNGRKINDIHDLTKKVEKIASICGIMAFTAIILLLWAVWQEKQIANEIAEIKQHVVAPK